MTLKAPLSYAELRATRERQSWDADVITLFWEIKRLRPVGLRPHPLSNDVKRPAGVTAGLYDDFMEILRAEPCVIERDQDVREMMEEPAKLRKGMAPR